MNSMTRPTTLMLAAGLAACAAAAAGPLDTAAAGNRIAPKQFFTAAVNGRTGEMGPVSILMACFGPIKPGETGHPDRGQTVGITQVYPPSPATTTVGYTGDRGTSIGAFFGAPPPSGRPSGSSYVAFKAYGTKLIPMSLQLPCSGSGNVTFVVLPIDPGSRDVTVPVTFTPQP